MLAQRKIQAVPAKEENCDMRTLAALTENLAPSLDMKTSKSRTVKEIVMDKGTAITFGVINKPKIAVAETFASGGSKFPLHSHEEKEYLVLYDGEMTISLDDKIVHLFVGDSVMINPGVEHSAEFMVDSWFIVASIPCAPGWPEV